MKWISLILLLFALNQQSIALTNDNHQSPPSTIERLNRVLEQAPVCDLSKILITDSGIKYSVPCSERFRSVLYIFFSDTGYRCIYDLQSCEEDIWETKRRFILREKGIVDYEIRCGVDFGGENLTIDYTVVPDYSLKNFEYDNMNRLDEIFNVFETLDHLKSCLHKNKEISQDKNEDTPITFVMGDAKISYFVALPTSEEANEITFTRQDTNGNKITKLASVPANSQNLTHGILLLLSENAIEYFESIVM